MELGQLAKKGVERAMDGLQITATIYTVLIYEILT
jgi:hypothetical protein